MCAQLVMCMLRSRQCRALAKQPPQSAGTAPHLLFGAVPLASRREVVLQQWARQPPSTRIAAASSWVRIRPACGNNSRRHVLAGQYKQELL